MATVCTVLFFCSGNDTMLEKGSANLELGDYERAIGCFNRILEHSPRSAAARLGLGKAFLQEYSVRPYDSTLLLRCITQLGAARTLSSDTAIEHLLSSVWFKRAQFLLGKADTSAALQALSRSTSLDPKAVGPVNLAGILCFNRGETKRARTLFDMVTVLDTASASGYFNAGMVCFADSDFVNAYHHFYEAAKRSPDDREILLWAAKAKVHIEGRSP